MELIIVTVKRLGEARVHDIELVTDRPLGQLLQTLAQSLGWDHDPSGQPLEYIAEAHPPGRFLRADETLAQAQIWDGTWLVLHPQLQRASVQASMVSPNQPAPIPDAPVSSPHPVSGWQPLSPVAPAVDPSQPSATTDPPSPGSGFSWKRVDDDQS